MRSLALLMLLLPAMANALGEGAWQASGPGITLNYRGQSASSAPLRASPPPGGMITLVAWRYSLNGPTPMNLRVRLCAQTRCVELDGQRGSTWGLADIPAAEPLRFVWEIPGGGRLIPPLFVSGTQLIVNYR